MTSQDAWRSLPMSQQNQHLLDTAEMSDCVFIVQYQGDEPQRISAHKLLLCRSSAVFQAMFTGGLQEKGDVVVTDITADVFRLMLRANMEADDVFPVFDVANLTDNQQLHQACVKMLREHTQAVFDSSGWVTCSCTLVSTLLQQDALNVSSELTLLTACQRWARHHIDKTTLREEMSAFLPHLRLRSLTAEQFVEGTLEDEIFTAEEKWQILRCLVKSELKMPAGLCDVITPRVLPECCRVEKVPESRVKSQVMNVVKFPTEVKHVAKYFAFKPSCPVLIYGCVYSPILSSSSGSFNNIMNNNKYKESLTLQLWEGYTTFLSFLQYEATLSYASKAGEGDVMLYFPKALLLEPEKVLNLEVIFQGSRIRGQRQVFGFHRNNMPWVEKGDIRFCNRCGVYNISALVYKKIQ